MNLQMDDCQSNACTSEADCGSCAIVARSEARAVKAEQKTEQLKTLIRHLRNLHRLSRASRHVRSRALGTLSEGWDARADDLHAKHEEQETQVQ